MYYTCQLFLRYKSEIFILGASSGIFVDDTIISKDSWRSPESSEGVQSLPKVKLSRKRLSTKSEIARKVLLFIHLHMVFVPYMGLS